MKTQHPRIPRHYTLVGHSPDCVELRYGVWNPVSFTLTDESRAGRLFKVLSLLDGSLSVAEIAQRVGVPRSDVEAVLDHLRELGALEEGGARTALDLYLDTAVPALRGTRTSDEDRPREVLLLGDPDITAELERYLSASLTGVPVRTISEDDPAAKALEQPGTDWLVDTLEFQERVTLFEPWRDRLVVQATKSINPVTLKKLNRVSLHLRFTWLHAAFDGPFLFVGPLFVPHRSSCYECFETRVTMNLRESSSYLQYKNALVEGKVRVGTLPLEPALTGLLAAHAALEVLNYCLTGTTFTVQKVLAVYLPTMEISYNDVLRVASCPACCPVPERDDKELYFDARILPLGGLTGS